MKEWIKGQFSVYFLLDFVFVDFCSQVFFGCFLVGFQPLKEKKTERKKLNLQMTDM